MSDSPSPPKIAAWRWGVVWLLFLATMLAYMDRLALNNSQRYLLSEFVPARTESIAADGGAVPAETPGELSERRNRVYSEVQFAFGVSFALFQIAAGFPIDRYSLRWLYFGAIGVWSLAGVLTGFIPTGGIELLLVCRVVLGIGEAFNWPCAVACIQRAIPRESRGLANGIFHSGASIGAVATPLFVLALVNQQTGEGWRTLFIVVGAVGAVWALLWILCTRGERRTAIDSLPASEDWKPPPFLWVFANPLFWICLGTGVCVNVCWHIYNQWFPRYLTDDLQVEAHTEQLVMAGFFVAADLGSMASGWTTRKLTRTGFSVERSRQIVMSGLAAIVCLATIPAAYLPARLIEVKVGCFLIVASAAMGGFAIFFSLAQDIIPSHTAKILGVCGCASWLGISGITWMIGHLHLAGAGKYGDLFMAVGMAPLGAAVVGWFWKSPSSRQG